MPSHRILIVDDQREVSRVLRSGLETLQHDFEIIELLSGEEALLELATHKIDLLVADVILPGISGLELFDKFQTRNPETKAILISGVVDPKIRQRVAQAGAEAFFFKPIELADFLDGVERALGLVETLLPNELLASRIDLEEEDEPVSLSDRIAELHHELDAFCVFLMSDLGEVLVRAGELPDPDLEEILAVDLIGHVNASVRISHILGLFMPDNLEIFRGKDYQLFLSPVGSHYSILVAASADAPIELGSIARAIDAAKQDLLKTLAHMGILNDNSREEVGVQEGSPKSPGEDIEDEEMAAILETANAKKAKQEEVDAFWDSAADNDTSKTAATGDSLSYEQAQQLGLAPSEKKKK